jgi:hypothetical protein
MSVQRIIPNRIGLWIYEYDLVPLTRREKDGSRTPVMCWSIDGKILVHPERLPMFMQFLARLEHEAAPLPDTNDDFIFGMLTNGRSDFHVERRRMHTAMNALAVKLGILAPERSSVDRFLTSFKVSEPGE